MLKKNSYTLAELADYADVQCVGDANQVIRGLNTLLQASSDELSFLARASYQKYLSSTQAGAVILHPDMVHVFKGNALVSSHPYYTFAVITALFADESSTSSLVHPSAVMGDYCTIGENVHIAANVTLGNYVNIADNVSIGASCVIGDHVTVGCDSMIHPHVSIYRRTKIGSSTIVHSQAVIGSDGFGFSPRPQGEGWQKIHQLGAVVIGSDVEIGAGTTIDCGALGDTIIGDGVKIDNQVQIAHNVEIGDHTAIAGAVAIAGSTVIGRCCTIAGAVGIVGHVVIADHVHITAMTMVTKSIKLSGSYSSGTPMNQTAVWRKNAARFNQLDELAKKVKGLHKDS